MVLIRDLSLQGAQMLLVLVLAPLLLGFTRKVKARLLRRRGPPVIQPYRDLAAPHPQGGRARRQRLMALPQRPYMIFAATWVAAALVPTFATGLEFSWTADLIVITALLGSARFFLALAGMDMGTSFGGIGSSREMMFASLAEPAMIMIVFTVALVAGSTQLSEIADFMLDQASLRVSLGLALVALIIVAIAENARIPVDNPATHLELTMVHEAMVLEYSGRHLAVIEFAAALKLLLYISLIACIFLPWGLAQAGTGLPPMSRCRGLSRQARRRRLSARPVRDVDRQDARLPRAGIPRRRPHARSARHVAALRFAELLMDGLLSISPTCSPAAWCWSASCCSIRTACSACSTSLRCRPSCSRLGGLAGAYPGRAASLRTARSRWSSRPSSFPWPCSRVVVRLGIHRNIETVVGIGPTMLLGMGLVALSMVVMLKATAAADPLAREDLAFALSVVLLGLLMMVTRRNAVSQIVGFMSLENGLILAATGAKGMPLVVEISVAFSVLVAFIVIGVFLFRIRERFDSRSTCRPSMNSGENGGDARLPTAVQPWRGARHPGGGGGAAGAAARLSARGAPQCPGDAADIPRLTVPLRRPAGARRLSLRRRSQHRLHRARHLRRLHHQRFSASYIGHELETAG